MTSAIEYLYNSIFEVVNTLFNSLMISEYWYDSEAQYNNIIDGELIKINLAWVDLPSVLTAFLVCILIYLFIMFIVKLLGVFVWK